MSDRVQLVHPQGKKLSAIDAQKYEQISEAIIRTLSSKPLTHSELTAGVEHILKDTFDGSVAWYVESVKLHLESNKVIYRDDSKPQKYYLHE